MLSNRIQESGVRIQQCFLYDWRIALRIAFSFRDANANGMATL
ncbi:hypothetical protein [Nostoc sp.]